MRGMLSYVSLVPAESPEADYSRVPAESPEAEYSRVPAKAAGAVRHRLLSVWHRAGSHVLHGLSQAVAVAGTASLTCEYLWLWLWQVLPADLADARVQPVVPPQAAARARPDIPGTGWWGGVGWWWGGGVAPADLTHTHA